MIILLNIEITIIEHDNLGILLLVILGLDV